MKDAAAEQVNVVSNLKPLLSIFFSGQSKKEGHLVLCPMNQIFFHTNLMLERVFPSVHTGFPWWHNDNIYNMEHYLLHLISVSLWSSSSSLVCDGGNILAEGSRFLSNEETIVMTSFVSQNIKSL